MRDTKRIGRILNKIRKAWKSNPDQRFCQLLINLCVIPNGHHWHREDEEIEEILELDCNGMINKRKRK